MPLIKDHAERTERAAEKRHALLRFLRDELYTTPAVAGEVIGVGERGARQTVLQMEKLGLVRRHVLPVLPGLLRHDVDCSPARFFSLDRP